MFTKTTVVLSALAALVSAAPTATTGNSPSKVVARTGATHSIVAGRGGLLFDPQNVVAQVGDVIEWHFTAKNHSVVQSSFANPCEPLDATSFFSGFFPVPVEGTQSAEVFQVVVETTDPIWYYCAQSADNHCQSGMAGVINQNFNSPNTLDAYKAKAQTASTPSGVQPQIQPAGARIPNPNPLSGF